MSDIISSENIDDLKSDSVIAYQVTDLKALAAKILRRANDVAQQKIKQAEQSIQDSHAKAIEDGHAAGYSEGFAKGEEEGKAAGEQAARDEFTQKVGGITAALQATLQDLSARKVSLQAEAEADLLELSVEIAKRIVRREVEVDPKFVLPVMQEAVALTNNKSDLTIHVNPCDLAAIEEELPTLKAIFSDLGRVDATPDNKIGKGGVRVMSPDGEIDMRLEEQFKALERALIGDTEGMREWEASMAANIAAAEELAPEITAASLPQDALSTTPEATPVPMPSEQASEQTPEVTAATEDKATETATPVTTQNQPEEQTPNASQATPQPEASSVPPQPASAPTAPPVQTSPSPKPTSSLAGVSNLESFSLDDKVENAIKETLGESSGMGK